MKTALRVVVVILLLINCTGAIFGGGNLILHPDGSSLVLSLDWLKHTPFDDYLIPGIILFISNGLFGFAALTTIFLGFKRSSLFIIAQGIILVVWLIVQVILIRTIIGLHIFTFVVGFLLILIGKSLNKMESEKMKPIIAKRFGKTS